MTTPNAGEYIDQQEILFIVEEMQIRQLFGRQPGALLKQEQQQTTPKYMFSIQSSNHISWHVLKGIEYLCSNKTCP